MKIFLRAMSLQLASFWVYSNNEDVCDEDDEVTFTSDGSNSNWLKHELIDTYSDLDRLKAWVLLLELSSTEEEEEVESAVEYSLMKQTSKSLLLCWGGFFFKLELVFSDSPVLLRMGMYKNWAENGSKSS